MPEVIRTFTTGKMNKDLDERLVPNGEYRDALNLEISTSDTGNVGALQNIDGNTAKLNKALNPNTGIYTPWTEGYINTLTNPRVIGQIKDSVTENIYWFIASDGISAIAEYNQIDDVVVPVLVDTQGILNFSQDYLITGINIIEDLLFFTDNQTEPKGLNIKDFKASTPNFQTHSVINGRDFIEEDITVIKKAPLVAPTLDLARTRAVDNEGNEATVETTTVQNFIVDDPNNPCLTLSCRIPAPLGTELTLNWATTPYPFYRTSDVLVLTGTAPMGTDDGTVGELAEYKVRVEVVSVPPGNTQTNATVKVLSVPETVQDQDITWEVVLEELPFFEFKFPRFAFRYKYKDGYYSTFSPFTEIAFLPGEFDYETRKGFNLGMVNELKQCVIKDFVPDDIPPDVIEVDLLYKESNSQSVYVVDTFKKDDAIWNEGGSNGNGFKVESEIISSILPGNQILRPYDNVPRKAKSQEITGNRLIYGNYLQNFNLKNELGIEVSPTLTQSIVHNSNWDVISGVHTLSDIGEPLARTPFKSIKTQRTYQVGVVFQGKYGRQTPVFTSESAALTLAKEEADKYNQIIVQTDGNKPEGFTHFKYYIKEPSNEYYNLAMDRHYDAEDGNAWISFPSAERNKVQEDTFLEIKKKHDSDEFVSEPAKYKVIAIKNEAPLFLRKEINSAGSIEDGGNDILDTGIPQPNRTWIDIDQSTFEDSSASVVLDTTDKQRLVRVFSTSAVSDYYNVASVSLTGPDSAQYYRISIEKKFGEDMAFTTNDAGDKQPGLSVELSFENFVDKPEFEGRFFVKLEKDSTLEKYILSDANNDNFAIGSTVKLGYTSKSMGRSAINDTFGGGSFFVDDGPVRNGDDNTGQEGTKYHGKGIVRGGGNTAGTLSIGFSGIWPRGGDFGVGRTIYTQYRDQVKTLMSDGGLLRFKEDPDQIVYKIVETEEVSRLRNYKNNKKHEKYNVGSNKRTRFDLRLEPVDPNDASKLQGPYPNKGLFQGINDNNGAWRSHFSGTNVARGPENGPELEFLKPFFEENSFTSSNPAIFETEPKETAELELFYAASEAYPISEYGNAHTLSWHNCYSFANGVESDRIRDDFNAVTVDNGPIVSSTLKEPYAEERRATGLIFSQIFNSISGVNSLNQFIQAEAITKDLNPIYGSIQKLHTRDTNLVTLCEDKCLRILTNKDALFNADGNANVTSNNAVLGQATPYVGEFGISLHPESFASYGFRAYFTDKNRGVVLRLSADGLEEISRYGMSDFFADNLKQSSITWGSYDDDKGGYNISLNNIATEWRNKFTDRIYINGNWNEFSTAHSVLTFKESTNGWESRKSFSEEGGISLNDRYYTFDRGNIWEHRTDDSVKNNFYGVQYDSSVTFLINEEPNTVKKYKTLNYSGSKSRAYVYGDGVYEGLSLAEVEALQLQNLTTQTLKNEGWFTEYINTDLQEGYVKEFLDKENKWFQYIKGEATYFTTNTDNNLDSKEFSMQGIGRATSVVGPPVTDFNVRIFGDPSCAVYIQNPTADPKTYSVAEDCTNCGALVLTGTDPQGLSLTFEIVSDNTQNGNLSAITGNQITFTPNVLNYYGSAGTFTYRTYNGTNYSDPATVTVTITAVAEPPQITSTPDPAQLNQTVGQTFTYTNITASDPDHDPLTELTWSTNNLPSGWTLTTTGDGFTGTATITGTVAQGNTTFEVVVTDPDGNTDTQEVTVGGIAAALLDLDFIAHSGNSQPAQTWTDPNDPTFVVPMKAKANSGHGCARGTYRLVANKHVNGGVVVGRFYVGNTAGNSGLYDSYTYDINGNPDSQTGDPSQSQVVSASAQGNTDSLGNANTLVYAVGSPEFGNDPNNSLQKYVTAAMANNQYIAGNPPTNYTRYSYLKMTPAQAQTIADNHPDTYNNCYVTFTFEPDTYNTGGGFNTHADAVGFQVVQKGSTQGYNGGPEIYSDKLGVASQTCQTNQPCPPSSWPYITFDVCTGAYIDTYDPLNPPSNPNY